MVTGMHVYASTGRNADMSMSFSYIRLRRPKHTAFQWVVKFISSIVPMPVRAA